MRRILNLLGAAWFGLAAVSAPAAHTQARLLLAAETARPGDTVLAGVQLRMDPRWHTYWRNPGAAGMATKVDWQLPPGVTAGAIQWPLPEKLPDEDLTTYIYTNEVVLLVPLKLAADLRPGPLDLKANVSWLECDVQCIPGDATVRRRSMSAPRPSPPRTPPCSRPGKARLPKSGASLSARAWWEKPPPANLRTLAPGMELASARRGRRLLPRCQRGLRSPAGHGQSPGRGRQDPPAQGGQEIQQGNGRSAFPAC